MSHRAAIIVFLSLILFIPLGAGAQDDASLKALFSPLPAASTNSANPITDAKVALGKQLFHDTRLSQGNDISCNSCHNLETYGVDNEKTSKGHGGQRGTRNSPTVYNSAAHFLQFWDGRAKDVEEQALGPILNPVEMAMGADVDVIERLKEDKNYVESFKKAFPDDKDPVTFSNLGKAIGAFERTLMTPSRFDAWLKGDDTALTAQEKEGVKTFRDVGCVSCHMGSTLGGQMFQKLGLVKHYETKDLGRYEVTKNEADKYMFKVPSLRNAEKTGPYFHDGSVESLDKAVMLMGEHQLGRTLDEKQVADIVAFIRSLTGELPKG